jgi:hypothetical protein
MAASATVQQREPPPVDVVVGGGCKGRLLLPISRAAVWRTAIAAVALPGRGGFRFARRIQRRAEAPCR